MKKFVIVLSFLVTQAFAGVLIPEGKYVGRGEITLPSGQKVNFDIESEITVTGNDTETIVDTYHFQGQEPGQFQYDLKFLESGAVVVSRDNKKAGKGLCLENSCHISFNFQDTGVMGEETLLVKGTTLRRIGTRATFLGKEQLVKTTLKLVE